MQSKTPFAGMGDKLGFSESTCQGVLVSKYICAAAKVWHPAHLSYFLSLAALDQYQAGGTYRKKLRKKSCSMKEITAILKNDWPEKLCNIEQF
jgi:hypothetical protein